MSASKATKSVTLIKLGGSIVTDKTQNQVYRQALVQQLGKELLAYQAESTDALFIGHGQGSFGHPIVAQYANHFVSREHFRPLPMAKMLRVVTMLHDYILDDLIALGVPVTSFRLSQQVAVDAQQAVSLNVDLLEQLFDLGVVPLTTGDIVVDAVKGNVVLSTEKIFLHLIRHLHQSARFRVRRVVYVTDVEGVLDHARQLIRTIGADQEIDETMFFSESGRSDVTGAMKHKVEAAQSVARLGIPVAILSPKKPNNLCNYLSGNDWIGTEIR